MLLTTPRLSLASGIQEWQRVPRNSSREYIQTVILDMWVGWCDGARISSLIETFSAECRPKPKIGSIYDGSNEK